MADSPPVTRKRSRNVDPSDRAVTRDRSKGTEWREASRSSRSEETEKMDKSKKRPLVIPLPSNITGVTAVLKAHAKADIREIESNVDMQPSDPDVRQNGAVQSTPMPPMPSPNRLVNKRQRMATWLKDPSSIKQELDIHKRAVARAKEEDSKVVTEREQFDRWFSIMRAHLTAQRRSTVYWSPAMEEVDGGESAPLSGGDGAGTVGPGGDSAASGGAAGRGTNDSPVSAVTSGDADSSVDGNIDATDAPLDKANGESPPGRDEEKSAGAGGGAGAGEGGDDSNGSNTAVVSTVTGGAAAGAGTADVGSSGGGGVSGVENRAAGSGIVSGSRGGWKRGPAGSRQETRWMCYLEKLAMKLSRLDEAFDMHKVVHAYGSSSEEVAALRRECSELIEARQAVDSGSCSGSASPVPFPSKEDEDSMPASDPVTKEQASVSPGPSDGSGGGGVPGDSVDGKTSGVEGVEDEAKVRATGGRVGKSTGEGSPPPARRGHKAADSGRCKVSGGYNTHPADQFLMDRWDGFLRAGDASGKRWQQMMGAGDLGSGWGPKSTNLNARDGMARRALVVPRGHDLLPSMRVPVFDRVSAPAAHRLCLLKPKKDNDEGGLLPGGAEAGQLSSPTIDGSGANLERIVEYVPWIGGGSSRGVCTDTAPAGEAGGTETAPRSIADEFRDRTQWFSGSLPMEALPPGTSPDERESLGLQSKFRVNMRRIEELQREVARRQKEMEGRRREKVDETVRLVRATAAHEDARQLHERRMHSLRKEHGKLQKELRKFSSDKDGANSATEPTDESSPTGAAGNGGAGGASGGQDSDAEEDAADSDRSARMEPGDDQNSASASNTTAGMDLVGDGDETRVGNGGEVGIAGGDTEDPASQEASTDTKKDGTPEESSAHLTSTVAATTTTTPAPTAPSRARSPVPPPSPTSVTPEAAQPSVQTSSTSLRSRSPVPRFSGTPPNGVGSASSDPCTNVGSEAASGKPSEAGESDEEVAESPGTLPAPPPPLTRERASPRTAARLAAYSSLTSSCGANAGDSKRAATGVDSKGSVDADRGGAIAGGKRVSGGTGTGMATRAGPKRRKAGDGSAIASAPGSKPQSSRPEDVAPGEATPNGDIPSQASSEATSASKSSSKEASATSNPGGTGLPGRNVRAKAAAKRSATGRARGKGTSRR